MGKEEKERKKREKNKRHSKEEKPKERGKCVRIKDEREGMGKRRREIERKRAKERDLE